MKNVVILGASGMVGGEVLKLCLANPEIDNVVAFVRKPLGIIHEKLQEIDHHDYTNFETVKTYLKYVDVCFFCIGVYTGAVPKDEFNKITIDMPVALGKAIKAQSPNVVFSLLSGMGADTTETSRTLFAKAKGIAENKLMALNFHRLHIFRPGYIYPIVPRKEPNVLYTLFRFLYKPLKGLMKNSSTTSMQLAEKMVEAAMTEADTQIFENRDIIKSY